MKKIIIAILAFAVTGSVDALAQGKWGADSAECIKYMSYYKEYYKQKSYDEALPNWRKAYSLCPATSSQNMLIDGTSMLRRLIQKNARNVEYRNALVDSLITLHKTRATYYPKYAVTSYNNLGTDLNNFVKDNPEKLYAGFEEIITTIGEKTKPAILLFDLNSAISLYQDGKLEAEQIIGIYQRNNDILEGIKPGNDSEDEQIKKIKSDLGSIFASSKVADCQTLISLYGPRIDEDPDNLQLATSIVKTMSITEDCNDNDVFLKAVTTMNNQAPSASSSYYLFRLHSAKGNVDEAISYLQKAIESDETDAEKDAEYTYELATFCYKCGRNSQAYELASSVAQTNQSLAGKAYFLIGNIWGGTRCGGDEIATRAPMWVACDFMIKAKNADETLTEEANRYIGQYSSYFPKTADAFMYGIENGQSYTVVCGGMRATTTVRTVN